MDAVEPRTNGTCVVRGIVVGENRASDITIERGIVTAIEPAGYRDACVGTKTTLIGPTLFDIHVNGANGINLQGGKTSPTDVRSLTDYLAGWGVSHWVPTLITNTPANMEHGCRVVAEALKDPVVAAAVPGLHIEGPYLSSGDGPRGMHAKRHIRKPSLREFDRLIKAADGHILYATVAPEAPGAIPFIKGLIRRGVSVAIGHHDAGHDEIARAVDAGARLSTHLGNGLAPEINRHNNPLWPQLANDDLSAAFIADLHHLPEPVLKTFVRIKGRERSILTSDCVPIAGLKPGRYAHHSGAKDSFVELLPSGRTRLGGTELLAGSSLMLLQGVINAARATDLTLEQAFACASRVPAGLLGVRHAFTMPTVGEKAGFVAFDIDQSSQNWKVLVKASFIDGERRA